MSVLYSALVYGAVVVALVAIHLVATDFSGRLSVASHTNIGITPATTLTHWWRHLWAGLFHTTPFHIAFNLALFTVAFPFAIKGHDPLRTVLGAYWIGPITVLALHLLVVLPLAQGGLTYAVEALNRPLVGFSVIAYALAGMAAIQAPRPFAVAAIVLVFSFELIVGTVLRLTGPFIFLYHLAGFGMGLLARASFGKPT